MAIVVGERLGVGLKLRTCLMGNALLITWRSGYLNLLSYTTRKMANLCGWVRLPVTFQLGHVSRDILMHCNSQFKYTKEDKTTTIRQTCIQTKVS